MSANPSQQRMQQGHAARKAGRTAEALDHYRTAVEEDPESAEANSVYGLMLLQVGRADEAETPLRRAVEIAPSHAALRMNLAQWLAQRMAGGKDLAFLVGGPEGLDAALSAKADFRWSLSPLTWPHGLVRIMVAEQLYRAHSLLQGHPYHRA